MAPRNIDKYAGHFFQMNLPVGSNAQDKHKSLPSSSKNRVSYESLSITSGFHSMDTKTYA